MKKKTSDEEYFYQLMGSFSKWLDEVIEAGVFTRITPYTKEQIEKRRLKNRRKRGLVK